MPNIYNHVEDKDLLNQRHPRDLYVTPPALIRHFFQTALPIFYAETPFRYRVDRNHGESFTILDLGAGDARWGEGARRYLANPLFELPVRVTGVDLEIPEQHYADTYYIHDYFQADRSYADVSFDMVVANPPFRDSLAQPIKGQPVSVQRPDDGLSFRDGVERTLNLARDCVRSDFGAIVLFHPYFFLWTQGRHERLYSQWSWRLPAVTYVIPWRVPLIEGETSGLPSEFAISVWFVDDTKDKWTTPTWVELRFLPPLNVKNVWRWEDEEA